MHPPPYLLDREAAHRRRELLAAAERDRLAAGAPTWAAAALPLPLDRRLRALAALAALLAGLLLGAGEAAAGGYRA